VTPYNFEDFDESLTKGAQKHRDNQQAYIWRKA